MLKAYRGRMLLLWLVITLFAGAACNLFTGRAEVTPTEPAIQSLPAQSNDNVQEHSQNLENEPSGSGRFEYTVSESELNSIVSKELAKQEQPVLSDPQINLVEGKVIVTGIVQQSGFSLATEIELVPTIDSNGVPYIEVVSMSVGPFSVPQDFQDQVTSTVNNLIFTQLTNSESDLQVDSITISENEMTLTGSNR